MEEIFFDGNEEAYDKAEFAVAVGSLLGGIASTALGGLVGADFGNISTYANILNQGKEFLESVEEAVGGNSTINPLNGVPDNQGYESFYQLKKAIGSAGTGMQWHHIVEQSIRNI